MHDFSMKIRSFTIIVITLLTCLTAYGQSGLECKNTNKKIKGYVWARIFEDKENAYYGNIVIKPKHVTPQFLIKISQSIKTKYCPAESIIINFYDNKDSLNHGWEIYNNDVKEARARAVYILDRSSGREFIRYSTRLGSPLDQTIDLSIKNGASM